MRLLDPIVTAGIVALLVGAPLILKMEDGRQLQIFGAAAFGLFFLWMVKILVSLASSKSDGGTIPTILSSLLLPLCVVLGLLALQIVPLPPTMLRVLSAPTYHLYQKSLSGWPVKLDYDLAGPTNSRAAASVETVTDNTAAPSYRLARTLSLAPTLTKSSLLSVAAYITFFLVATFYPFDAGSAAVAPKLIAAMLLSGILVASLGLFEFVVGSGGGPTLGMTRASAPYANPDHFANYLGMIFPLALAGVLFRFPSASRRTPWLARFCCGGALMLIVAGVFLSFSRAVWLSLPVALAIFWRMVSPQLAGKLSSGLPDPAITHSHGRRAFPGDERTMSPAIGWLSSKWWLGYGMLLAIFAAGFLFIGGTSARTGVDQRLGAAFFDMSLIERVHLSGDTLPMIVAFPIFGVGLGNWAEVFPHFISPPSSGMFQSHAHNDYLELAAEIGLAGMVAIGWFGWRLIAALRSGVAAIGPLQWPWFAAVISGVVVAALHELFEFSLRTTPNVLLFCALLAIAVRLATPKTNAVVRVRKTTMFAGASMGVLGAPVLMLLATTQPSMRFDLWPTPQNRKQAVDQIVNYPADARPHLWLARFDQAPTSQAIREFEIATWLDPHNPIVRDSYIQLLLNSGLEKAATEQMEAAVMYSPSLDHPYLTEEMVPMLSAPERQAIEIGYQNAITRGYHGAVGGLAGFYTLSNRPLDVAQLYLQQAASPQLPSDQRQRMLLSAGAALRKAGKNQEARAAFEQAAALDPSDVNPYLALLSLVDGPTKDLDSAKATVEKGISNGADPVVLYSAFAQAAQAANRPEVTGAALKEVVKYAPTVENNERLAEFYIASGKPDLAVDTMRKATTLEPDSADAYVRLAAAEEAAYLYADAGRDYSRAIELAPNSAEMKSRYQEFQKRTSESGTGATQPVN